MPQIKKKLINERVLKAKNISEKIKENIMKKKIGTKEKFLYESVGLSYTDNYFKVNLISKTDKIKSGSIIEGTVLCEQRQVSGKSINGIWLV